MTVEMRHEGHRSLAENYSVTTCDEAVRTVYFALLGLGFMPESVVSGFRTIADEFESRSVLPKEGS